MTLFFPNDRWQKSERSFRRLLTLGTPIALAIVSIIHPNPFLPFNQLPLNGPDDVQFIQSHVTLWLSVHVAQLFLIGLLGMAVWYLIEGIGGSAATVSRIALFPFMVFYSAYDSIVGIGTGLLAWQSQTLTGQESIIANQVIQRFWEARIDIGSPLPGVIILLADATWIVAAVAAALALQKAGVSRGAVGLMIVAGVFFGIDHPFPTGTIGMLSLLGAVVLIERQGIRAKEKSLVR